jgi:hypothetical protein
MLLQFVSSSCIEQSEIVDATFQALDIIVDFNLCDFAAFQVVDSRPNATDVLLLDGDEPSQHQLVQDFSVSRSHYSKFLVGHTEASFHQHSDHRTNNSRGGISGECKIIHPA